ncbi:glycosyltransferase family 9 protein [Thermobifida fusca]|jgi:ADP-heptose:LPS heptosyltransferase|uniref:Glycosyltransferase n=2 Tax=Thermobifida fusca TaxID=2021 RepID=A0A9P2WRP5_THEFU|nr:MULTISPECIES: glycosyltransferase family 9 protein [Thermobifida]AAZ54932.1 putative glycosyltransferase [Thermobifida fusca YX]EOR72046.1 glycosyltransferase [Thermobifida fusca TM51]MBO2531079.1 glycosyltransferase family 9 protein [Thermobifida sp.]PPS91820.1 glycosyl transferase [Thermobifida fusca]PZN61866.1 MAG: glycosyltransferase family 9 protein [Thermobifida fusca]
MKEQYGFVPAFPLPPLAPGERERPILLVLRARGLGDFVTAVPALRALSRTFSQHRPILAGPESTAELLALAGLPWETVTVTGPVTPPWSGLSPPDIAVNLHGRGPQSTRALAALHPRLLWAHYDPDDAIVPGPAWTVDLHEVDRWCRLLAYYGITADPEDLRWPVPPEEKDTSSTVVIHPGAAFAARRWPELRFAEIARHLRDQGMRVVVTGSPAEQRLAERIARVAGLSPQDDLAGRTGLSQLASLIAHARLVVSGDTGVAHLATAYGTPSVTLFGPSSPATWGPRIDRERHRCLWSGTTGDPRATRVDPGLAAITTDEVLEACTDLLASLPR